MSHAMSDATTRFSDRVENYVRYRPQYPIEVLTVLSQQAGLSPTAQIADVGSGTGISSKLFLDHGNVVFAVEPNREMRAAAEATLGQEPNFRSVGGAAEHTTLPDCSVDLIIAGQAFHWFDRQAAKREFARILRPGGYVVLMWNSRRFDSAFAHDYELFMHTFGTDYRDVNHKNIDPVAIAEFFAPAAVQFAKVANQQLLDEAGLIGRIESCSYMPATNHPRHSEMIDAAKKLFADHQRDGNVCIEYDTELYFGQLT